VSKTKRRKFKGFAALDERGNLLWGTICTKKDRAKELFDNWNPDPTGEGMLEKIVEVELYLKD